MGLCYILLGRPAEAVEPIRQAIQLNAGEARFYGGWDWALAGIKRYRESAAEFEKALHIDPGYFDTQPELRQVWEAAKAETSRMPYVKDAPRAERAKEKAVESSVMTTGSGFFISSDGYLVTAAHVLGNSSKVFIRSASGELPTRIVKIDSANDIAILKAAGSFQPLPLGNSASVTLGAAIFTVGYPNVPIQGLQPKVTKGDINSLAGLQDDPRQFQVSVPLQPGNSGGALVDMHGNVIGIVVAKLDAAKALKITGDLPQNVNYAIKINYLKLLMESVPEIAKGLRQPVPVSRPFEEDVKEATAASALLLIKK